MKFKKLSPNSGLKVSALCLGTWHLPRLPERDDTGAHLIDESEFKRVLKFAYDNGVIFLDTANRYHGGISPVPLTHVGNAERLLGKLIKELGIDREELVIATKVGNRMSLGPNGAGLSRKHVMWQIRESLKRLQMGYVDIYYMHIHDPDTPKREIMSTFTQLVNLGLIRYIGASNIPAPDLVEMIEVAERLNLEPITVLQYRYNLLERQIEKDIIPIAQRYGIGIAAYSPLAQGLLTGKYVDVEKRKWVIPALSRATYMKSFVKRYLTDKHLEFMLKYIEFAGEKGISPAQLALAWVINMERVWKVPIVPIISVSKLKHLEEAIEAIEITLKDDDLKYLDELVKKFKR